MIVQKTDFKYLDFFVKYPHIVFSIVPRKGMTVELRFSTLWLSVFTYIRHRMQELNFKKLHDLMNVIFLEIAYLLFYIFHSIK